MPAHLLQEWSGYGASASSPAPGARKYVTKAPRSGWLPKASDVSVACTRTPRRSCIILAICLQSAACALLPLRAQGVKPAFRFLTSAALLSQLCHLFQLQHHQHVYLKGERSRLRPRKLKAPIAPMPPDQPPRHRLPSSLTLAAS